MQQNKSYWWIIAGACMGGALVAGACTVTTSSDVGSDAGISAGGTAGTAGTAGTGTAGVSTAGGSGTSGGAGTAGTAGSAGNSNEPYQCDPSDPNAPVGMDYPNCTPVLAGDKCLQCIQANCCTEYKKCYATSTTTAKGNQCGWGGPNGGGEFMCYYACMINAVADAGVGDPTDCANNHDCASVKDSSGATCPMAGLGVATTDLIACVAASSCAADCGF